MAQVLEFKIRYITVGALCSACNKTWLAKIREQDAKKFADGLSKTLAICKSCGNVSVQYFDLME